MTKIKIIASAALAAGQVHWAWKPKFHQFEHLLDEILRTHYNPRFEWNYADEDAIGHYIVTAEGTHPWTVPLSTVQRHNVDMVLRWQDRGGVPTGVRPGY